GTVPADQLSSAMHVAFTMECIGVAFSLPVSQQSTVIIERAIEVYRDWLAGKNRPAPVNDAEQAFFRKVFLHFSLLFNAELSSGATNVDAHARLCLSIISLLKNSCEEWRRDRLELATWELLITVVLGMADSVFVGADIAGSLGTKIGPSLLQ